MNKWNQLLKALDQLITERHPGTNNPCGAIFGDLEGRTVLVPVANQASSTAALDPRTPAMAPNGLVDVPKKTPRQTRGVLVFGIPLAAT